MGLVKLSHLRLVASVGLLVSTSAWGQFPTPVVVPAAAARGAKIYGNSCAKCHGADVRGTPTGPDLIRSLVVLHDRLNALHGTEMGPVLKSGPIHKFNFDKDQLLDLSQFLTQSVNKTLRSGYSNQPTNLLGGDAKAGETYFNSAGGCVKCHSVTGDLAGVGKRYDPAALQQKFLFPNGSGRGVRPVLPTKKIEVNVTLRSGKSFSGQLVRIDDFTVAFRDDAGTYHSFVRSDGVKVRTVDPFAAHIALLDKYTDADIHNLTTYLEMLK